MQRKSYVLTARAVADLREARAWSLARWGQPLTDCYFDDLHAGAQYVAAHHATLRRRTEGAGSTALCVYPVREHYLVYEPLTPRYIVIVAVIRQGRDIPTILQKWATPIRRELVEIRKKIKRGEIRVPSRASPRSRRRNGDRS